MADETAGLALPVGLTEKQFLQQVTRIESRLAKMEGDAIKRFTGIKQSASKAFDGIDASAQGMSRSTQASLQNVGYQVQDMIVQIQGGQGVMRSLSQQLPQLLSGFGLIGVAAGTLAPLVLAVGSALIGTGVSAKAVEEDMKALASAISELEAAQKNTTISSVDLAAKFGPMADQARQLYDVQKRLAQLNLEGTLTRAISDLNSTGSFSGVSNGAAEDWKNLGAAADEYFAKLKAAKDAGSTYDIGALLTQFRQAQEAIGLPIASLETLKKQFGVTYTEAGQLAAAFSQLANAGTLDQQAAAAADLRERLSEALKNMDGSNDKAVKLVENLLDVEDAALRAKAVDIAGGISAGADEAKRMADEIGRALNNAQALVNSSLSDLEVAKIKYQYRTDPVGEAGATAAYNYDKTRPPEGTDAVTMKEWRLEREQVIANARAKAEYTEKTNAANKADRDAANAANKSAKAMESAQEKYQKSIVTLEGNIATTEQQIEAYQGLNLAGGKISTQLTAIAERQKLLTAAQKAGVDLTPEQIAQADALSQKYAAQVEELDRLKSVASNGQNAMNDLFGAMLEGADSAKEAVINLIAQIAKVQFSKGMMSLLGMTSWGSGLVGSLGSLLTANAKGGVYDSPSLSAYSGTIVSSPTLFKFASGGGLMGEAGPEAILPLSRMTNGELGVKTQGGSPQGHSVSISVDVTGAKGNTEIQQMVSQGIAQGLKTYDKSLPDRVQQINQKPWRR